MGRLESDDFKIERKREKEGKSYHVSEGIHMCLATNKNIGNSK